MLLFIADILAFMFALLGISPLVLIFLGLLYFSGIFGFLFRLVLIIVGIVLVVNTVGWIINRVTAMVADMASWFIVHPHQMVNTIFMIIGVIVAAWLEYIEKKRFKNS